MRIRYPSSYALVGSLLASAASSATTSQLASESHQRDNHDVPEATEVSIALFGDLERTARLVDISYCVGTTGVSSPFSCASRCKDFPTLELASTWHTGALLSDSCGYIAVDHGMGEAKDGDRPHEPAIVVAFRGTYSITNTVVDLSTVPQEYVPYPAPDDGTGDSKSKPEHKCENCTVHAGFLASWRAAREVVLPRLKAAHEEHPSYPVHLTGHSLGGAVAALASLELRVSLGWEDITVTTFGEPMVGNAAFVAYLDKVFGLDPDGDGNGYDEDLEKRPYRRVTHAGDPVPLLPLEEWGFRPHAGEVHIAKSSLQPAPEDLRLCLGDADPNCIAGADKRTARLKLWQLFFSHRDYFWRLGLCLPGGDPWDWGRDRYNVSDTFTDEL